MLFVQLKRMIFCLVWSITGIYLLILASLISQVTCSVRELPQDFPHESPIKSFAIKDLIRGVVLDVPRSPEKVAISMLASALPADKRHIKLVSTGIRFTMWSSFIYLFRLFYLGFIILG